MANPNLTETERDVFLALYPKINEAAKELAAALYPYAEFQCIRDMDDKTIEVAYLDGDEISVYTLTWDKLFDYQIHMDAVAEAKRQQAETWKKTQDEARRKQYEALKAEFENA